MKPSSSNDFSRGLYGRLYLIAALELLLICLWSLATKACPNDSESYFSAFQVIVGGSPDHLRTPLYPLVAGGLRALLGVTGGCVVLYLIQSAVFIASIRWFGTLCSALVPDSSVGRIVLIIYALYPGPLTLCGVVLTDAFALSASVGLLLLLYRALALSSWRYAAWTALLMSAMLMLRPAFLYVPLAAGLFWIVVAALHRTRPAVWLTGLASATMALGVLAFYCVAMKATYGITGPSSVSGANNYFTVRYAGILHPQELEREDLQPVADSLLRRHGAEPALELVWSEVSTLSALTHPCELSEITTAAIKAHPKEVAKYIASKRAADVADADCVYGGSVCPPVRAVTRMLSPNNGAAFLMLLILMILLARHDMRMRRFSTFIWFMCGLFIVVYATVLIGAQNEYPRLLLPNYPVLLVLAGRLFSMFRS